MRPTLRVTLAAALLALAASAIWAAAWAAEAVQSTRFDVTVVRKEGAALSGLAEDASGLIVSDLAAGRLYRFADGVFAPFGPELPHGLDVIGDPTGPYRIMPTADGYVVAQGWTPTDADEGPLDHAILEIAEGGAARVVSSDFWNPFDVMIDGDGMLVVDAGRNALTRLSRSGEGQTIATFPRLEQAGASMQGLSPTEFPKSERYAVDAVPTAVAASGGRLFVTQLGGFPYLDGSGRIVSLAAKAPHGPARVEVEGLNAPVDISISGDGGPALVLEHGRYDRAAGFLPGSGRLLRVDLRGGVRRPIAWGLTRPVSFTRLGDGRIVIACLDGALVFLSTGD